MNSKFNTYEKIMDEVARVWGDNKTAIYSIHNIVNDFFYKKESKKSIDNNELHNDKSFNDLFIISKSKTKEDFFKIVPYLSGYIDLISVTFYFFDHTNSTYHKIDNKNLYNKFIIHPTYQIEFINPDRFIHIFYHYKFD